MRFRAFAHTRFMAYSPAWRTAGVVFPEVDGKRSTSALGRAVVADALRDVDPVGAQAAERETTWRQGYLTHYRRLVEAGLLRDGEAAVDIARAGPHLAALPDARHRRQTAGEVPVGEIFGAAGGPALETATVRGTGRRATELSVPLHGHRLSGDAAAPPARRLDGSRGHGALGRGGGAPRHGEPGLARPVRPAAGGAGRGCRDGTAARRTRLGWRCGGARPPAPRPLEAGARGGRRLGGHAPPAGGRRVLVVRG